jgi:DNA-binding CsgD family transcriptional regulator
MSHATLEQYEARPEIQHLISALRALRPSETTLHAPHDFAAKVYAKLATSASSSPVEGWLEWFATHKQATCQAYLCTQYHLNALDAQALINATLLQVSLHWATLQHPLAYFWHTLKHAVWKQTQRQSWEQQQLAAYGRQHRRDADGAEGLTQQVGNLLERVSPAQQQLLQWRLQGYDDTQIAEWLQTTSQAVRVQRHRLMRILQAQLRPSDGQSPTAQEGHEFLGVPIRGIQRCDKDHQSAV